MARIINCKHCGEEFVAPAPATKFCCVACREDHAEESKKKRPGLVDFSEIGAPTAIREEAEVERWRKTAVSLACSAKQGFEGCNTDCCFADGFYCDEAAYLAFETFEKVKRN